ncbi:MAG: VCBS repeat-containing protein, partial [Myxococcales bacterium]|nr:VCBS repeat-containing protein [Myxococcales bacterium]
MVTRHWITAIGAISVLGLACSGDDNASGSESATSTVGSVGTESASASATETASGSESASATDSDSGTGSASATTGTTGGTDTTVGTTTSDSDTSASESDTGACTPCGDECCTADQVCEELQCIKDCGGDPPCGPQQECCGDGQICYLEACVDPGPACGQIMCATQQQESECDDGYICDPNLGLCVPTSADEGCQYIPDAGVFAAKPQFTWGKRKSVNCNNDSACQTGEICENGKCAVTWPHFEPAADDKPSHYQVSSIPVVADLDNDCVPEVIFNSYAGTTITSNGVLRALRGDTGEKVWTVTDAAYETDSTSNIAVADIDSDGAAEVIACGEGNYLIAIDSDGTPLWKSDTFAGARSSGSIAVANFDNEGDPEIVFGAAVYDSSGKLLYEGNQGIGRNGQGPISCIADLDGDDRPELIGGRTAYTFTGTVAQGDFSGSVFWNTNLSDGFCGVADLDNDEFPEVVLVANTRIYVLNGQNGGIRAQYNIPGGGRGGPPNIADFDGDGVPDIAAAGSTRYIVLKFDGQTDTLTKHWHAVTQDGSSQVTGSSVFDFDGDGRNEVVYNDEVYLRIYPGVEPDCQLDPPGPACDGVMTDAEILLKDRNSSRTRTEYPVIADVDGDFKAEIVFSTNNDSGFSYDAGIEVWGDTLDNWVATRPIWNQHTYHVTNVDLTGG